MMQAEGPLVRLAELEIEPARLEEYEALLREEIEASMTLEPGVIALHAFAVKGSPEMIRVFEIYADRAAYDAHLATPHFLKYKTLSAGMVRSLRLIETDPVLLRDKGGLFSR